MIVAQIRLVPVLAATCLLLTACGNQEGDSVSLGVYRQRLAALNDHDFFQTTRIVDRHGNLLAEVAPYGHRTWVPIDAIPEWFLQAAIATEDQTFRDNSGVDTAAVARAALQNAQAGRTISGASTITMQLVRMVAFDPEERFEASLDRKVLEAQLAAEIADEFTKDEILEAYLNVAFFGNHAYGVEAATTRYFGHSVRDASVAEATLLVGLLQAPVHLDPYENLGGALARRRVVLDLMTNAGYLTPEEADIVADTPVEIAVPPDTPPRRAEHFVDYVLQGALPELIGSHLSARGGYTVTTALDLGLNERLAAIATQHVADLRVEHDVTDAAAVALKPRSGEILAMVGGIDYDDPQDGQVNVALSPRQPGSAFKPITYAAALENGWSTASLLWDMPLSFPVGDGSFYRPRNYDGRYRGPVRLRQALANSLNAAAVHLLNEVGVAEVHELAGKMGLRLEPDPWQYGLSLTLGGAEVPLLDLTSSYATLAGGGLHVRPAAILKIEPIGGGAPYYELTPEPERVLSAETAWLVSDVLSDVQARRPAFSPRGPLTTSRPTAVKTGTTDDYRDNVTVGYTPYLAIGVWTGNKDGRPMRDVLGITGAAPIWHDAMEATFADPAVMRILGDGNLPDDGFRQPGAIVHAPVCDLHTLTVDGKCRRREEVFAAVATFTDLGTVFDWVNARSQTTAAAGDAGLCAVPDGAPGGRRQVFLNVPGDPHLAPQVREWAGHHGIRVAPPPCDELAEAALGAASPVAAAQLPVQP